jgi:hypothetical protein
VSFKMILARKSKLGIFASCYWTNRAWRGRERLRLDVLRVLGYNMTLHVSRFRCAMRTALDWTRLRFLMGFPVSAVREVSKLDYPYLHVVDLLEEVLFRVRSGTDFADVQSIS